MYIGLFCFLCTNIWRIIIKLRKYSLIPLTIFYLSATVIIVTRIIDNAGYIKFYADDMDSNSNAYRIGMKAAIVSNYSNIVMGIFQVASIIELFFVLGSIK